MFNTSVELRSVTSIVRYRWIVIVLAFALMGVTSVSLPKLTKDTSADAFIDPDLPALIYKEKVEQVFGLTDPIVLAVANDSVNGIYQPANLALVERLTRALENVPFIDPEKIVSLATEKNIVGTQDGILVDGFLDDQADFFDSNKWSDQRALEIRSAINKLPLYQGMLVGEKGNITLIIAEIMEEDHAKAVYNDVLKIVEDENIPEGTRVHVAGEGAVAGYLSTYIDNDAKKLNPLAGLIITIILLAGFVSVRAAILPNLIVAGTVLGSFGLMAASDTSFFVITNGLVVNLIGISVADSIHILSAYYSRLRENPNISQQEAVTDAVNRMWRPITLTSLTTIAGFLALAFSATMPPVTAFGFFGAVGVALAWVYSLTLLPALMAVWPSKRIPRPFRSDSADSVGRNAVEALMVSVGRTILNKPKIVLIAGVLVAVFGVAGAARLVVDEDRIENFKSTEAVYQADKIINRNTKGIYSLDILVETKEPYGLYDSNVLKRIESMQKFAETLPNVGGSTSIVDYVKLLNRSVNEGDPAQYLIPENRDLIAQLFFLYGATADPTDFEEEVDFEHRQALVRVHVTEGRYINNKLLVPALEDYVADVFNDETVKATVTGRTTVSYYWINGIDQSTLFSILLSFGAVTLTAILVFRSIVSGLLAALPVGLAILVVYAVMGWFGIPLSVGTSMFAAIAIGLSIDFAIHALDRLREIGQERGLSPSALVDFYPETGRALFLNFAAVGGGFGVLMTSEVPPLIKFGALVAIAVTIAFVASVTLLPALVTLLKPTALTKIKEKEIENAHAVSSL